MKYDKLVRDKIPHVIQRNGGTARVRVASSEEYWHKLKEKLHEELEEFKEAESIEEMADMLEVVDAMIEFKKFDRSELRLVKNKKAKERGRFKKRIILEEA